LRLAQDQGQFEQSQGLAQRQLQYQQQNRAADRMAGMRETDRANLEYATEQGLKATQKPGPEKPDWRMTTDPATGQQYWVDYNQGPGSTQTPFGGRPPLSEPGGGGTGTGSTDPVDVKRRQDILTNLGLDQSATDEKIANKGYARGGGSAKQTREYFESTTGIPISAEEKDILDTLDDYKSGKETPEDALAAIQSIVSDPRALNGSRFYLYPETIAEITALEKSLSGPGALETALQPFTNTLSRNFESMRAAFGGQQSGAGRRF